MRRRKFLEVAGSALTASYACKILAAEAKSPLAADDEFILTLEKRWMDAMVRRDGATLKELMADDFKRIEKPSPNVGMYKAQWIGNTIRFSRVESFTYLTLKANVSEKTAVVSISYRWRGVDDERPFHEVVTAEDTWELRDGKWLVVNRFVSNVVKNGPPNTAFTRRKAIKLDPAIYGAYIGQYKFGNNRILTISRDGDSLIHQGSGGNRVELFPEGQDRFFRNDAPVLTTFVKDGHGQVTQVIHRHTSGRISVGNRIA